MFDDESRRNIIYEIHLQHKPQQRSCAWDYPYIQRMKEANKLEKEDETRLVFYLSFAGWSSIKENDTKKSHYGILSVFLH